MGKEFVRHPPPSAALGRWERAERVIRVRVKSGIKSCPLVDLFVCGAGPGAAFPGRGTLGSGQCGDGAG